MLLLNHHPSDEITNLVVAVAVVAAEMSQRPRKASAAKLFSSCQNKKQEKAAKLVESAQVMCQWNESERSRRTQTTDAATSLSDGDLWLIMEKWVT